MLVRYDRRGFGASRCAPADISAASLVRDLEAVCGALRLEGATLFVSMSDGPLACVHAAGHPGQVENLILWNTSAAGMQRPTRNEMFESVIELDWRAYTNAYMRELWGWSRAEDARTYSRLLRTSTDAVTFRRWRAGALETDARALLPSVAARTLVVDHPACTLPGRDGASQEMAAAIPGATLLSLDGPNYAQWTDAAETERAFRVLVDFIDGEALVPASTTKTSEPGSIGTVIILFADIVQSTALTERLGDAAFRVRAGAMDAALRTIISEHGGTAVDGRLVGDGVLATFSSASQAITAALACGRSGDHHELPLHLVLHAGDVIRESENVFGGAVNIASRISALAAPGELLVSRTVADLSRTSAGVTFQDRGAHALKGVADPVHVFAVYPKE